MKTLTLRSLLFVGFLVLSFERDTEATISTSFLKRKLPTIPTLSLPLLPPIKFELLPAIQDATQDLTTVTEVPIISDEDFFTPDDTVDILKPTSSSTAAPTVPATFVSSTTLAYADPNPTAEVEDPEESETDLGNFIIKKLTNIEKKLDQLQEELRKTQTSLASHDANTQKLQPQTEENLSQFARILSENLSTSLGHLKENITTAWAESDNSTEEASTRSTNLPSYPFGIPSLSSLKDAATVPPLPAGWTLGPFPSFLSSNGTDPNPTIIIGTEEPVLKGSEDKNPASPYFDIDNYVPDVGLISDDPNLIKFLLFTNSQNFDEYETLDFGNIESIKSSNYDPTKPVKFLVHGFQNNFMSTFPQNVKNAYLSRNFGYNIIIVDWGKLAIPNAPYIAPVFYPFAVKNVWRTGERLGEFITWLKQENLIDLNSLHIVGFSLGSHVSGKAASVVQDRFNQSVARVTALDPAGPEFYTGIFARKLRVSDAQFVDAIHTNAGQLGIWADIGHVDYFVNGGSGPQPGCIGFDSVAKVIKSVTSTIAGSCSHMRATQFFAKTISVGDSRSDESKLCSCSSVTNYKLNLCKCEKRVGFGEYSAPGTVGTHFIDFKL